MARVRPILSTKRKNDPENNARSEPVVYSVGVLTANETKCKNVRSGVSLFHVNGRSTETRADNRNGREIILDDVES